MSQSYDLPRPAIVTAQDPDSNELVATCVLADEADAPAVERALLLLRPIKVGPLLRVQTFKPEPEEEENS